MQVPFRRLQKLEEAAEIKEICDVAEECAEIAGATTPPVPETITVASTEEPASTLPVEKLPKRITKKWLNSQPVQILQEILERADLTAARRKTIKAHLEERKD
jgi:hypothetical protein